MNLEHSKLVSVIKTNLKFGGVIMNQHILKRALYEMIAVGHRDISFVWVRHFNMICIHDFYLELLLLCKHSVEKFESAKLHLFYKMKTTRHINYTNHLSCPFTFF